MNRSALALLILAVTIVTAHGQSIARVSRSDNAVTGEETSDVARSLVALRRLDRDVFFYRSLGDFEEHGKIARVSWETFSNDLQQVSEEVEPRLTRLPPGKLKTEIANGHHSAMQYKWLNGLLYQQAHLPKTLPEIYHPVTTGTAQLDRR